MIEVNEDYCKGCNLCIIYCPRDALEESEELNKKGVHEPVEIEDRCNNCRLCELICPDFAITVIEEDDDVEEGEGDEEDDLEGLKKKGKGLVEEHG